MTLPISAIRHTTAPPIAQTVGPVLLVDNFLSRSRGNVSVSEELAERLRQAGWDILTTSTQPGRIAKTVDMIRTTWANRSRYEVANVSVYSGRAFYWAEAVAWVLRRCHKPYALTLHGGGLPAFAERHPRRVARLLESAAVVVAPSGYLRDKMSRYRSRLELLPNAIDLHAYPFRLRRNPAPRLVWLRSFHRLYNPVLAVRVLERLSRTFADIRLTMIGNDKGDGSLAEARRLAARHGLAGQIDFPGKCSKTDVPGVLSRGDIFLNTTNVDNLPVSVIEALACGLCVVSTNAGGIPYLLQHGHDALLVNPGDDREMADAVRRILTDSILAAGLSVNARLKARQFDWSVLLPEWERIFRSLKPAS